jgi:hypothetical protein
MKFIDIGLEGTAFPGEYLLHKPSAAIVLVGAFNREGNMIKAFKHGRLFEDKIINFQKIELDQQEYKKHKDTKCKKCKGSGK